MDLNQQYARHQRALMGAVGAADVDDRIAKLAQASLIAGRISEFQHGLGAAAACAWSKAQFDSAAILNTGSESAFCSPSTLPSTTREGRETRVVIASPSV